MNEKIPLLLCGDEKGVVHVAKLSPNLRKCTDDVDVLDETPAFPQASPAKQADQAAAEEGEEEKGDVQLTPAEIAAAEKKVGYFGRGVFRPFDGLCRCTWRARRRELKP